LSGGKQGAKSEKKGMGEEGREGKEESWKSKS